MNAIPANAMAQERVISPNLSPMVRLARLQPNVPRAFASMAFVATMRARGAALPVLQRKGDKAQAARVEVSLPERIRMTNVSVPFAMRVAHAHPLPA